MHQVIQNQIHDYADQNHADEDQNQINSNQPRPDQRSNIVDHPVENQNIDDDHSHQNDDNDDLESMSSHVSLDLGLKLAIFPDP